MASDKYIRVEYEKYYPKTNAFITWVISGPIRLLDGVITTASLGLVPGQMSAFLDDRFRTHKLTKELMLEEKLNR